MKKIVYFFCFFISSTWLTAQSNIDFELSSIGQYTNSTAVSGWTVESALNVPGNCLSSLNNYAWNQPVSQFSIVQTPIVGNPLLNPFSIDNVTIPNSPFGGINVARLNDSYGGNLITRAKTTLIVNQTNSLLEFAYAGSWDGSGHLCCDQPFLKINMYDCFGAPLACNSLTYVPAGSSCQNGSTGYSVSTGGVSWTNWQTRYVDLTPYMGSCVTLEVITGDCTGNSHHGCVYFDAQLISPFLFGIPSINVDYGIPFLSPLQSPGVSFCSGSGIAQIAGPPGYSTYQWYDPTGSAIPASQGGTLSTITILNPWLYSVYTLDLSLPSGCQFINTYTLAYTSVNIVAIASSSTCSMGASGSATVVSNGSGTGYNYTWLNSTNSVVSTSSVVSGLPSGIYSVSITASSSPNCGSAVSTVTINTSAPSVINLLKPYCSSEAYMCANSSTNVQWYSGSTPISGPLGSVQCFTASAPTNGGIFRVTDISSQGCRDSIQFILVSTPPGSLQVATPSLICSGASNGNAVVNLFPATGAPPGSNSYSVFSIGSTPAYSSSLFPTSTNSFTATNLSAGNYSVTGFDGSCKYSTSFSVTELLFNYSLIPSNSPTVCSGNAIAAGINFNAAVGFGQYTYSWSPSTFLPFSTNQISTIILPSTPPGIITTLIYTVVVTPTLVNCPLTKTLSITVANPVTPTIMTIPSLCDNPLYNYTISTNPSGGLFSNNAAIGSTNGIIQPLMASIGLNTFTYATSVGTCIAQSTGSFIVTASPSINVSGNTNICKGQSTILLANGANTYTWNTNSTTPYITVSPSVTTSYNVTGTNLQNNCTANVTTTVTVLPTPTLSISGNTLVCLGQSATLSASGANTYSWNTGSVNQNIVILPLLNTSYTIVGISNQGCTNSTTVLVSVQTCTTATTTGVSERGENTSVIKIFPNPTNGKFFIEADYEVKTFIYDELGKLILWQTISQGKHEIDFKNYADGIYFLNIVGQNGIKTLKLVKSGSD